MSGNDERAKGIARKILNDYQRANNKVARMARDNRITASQLRGYQQDNRDHAERELKKLSKGHGVSSEMSKRIEGTARKVKGHKPGESHGAWWANDSGGSSNDPSGWI